MQLRFDFRTVAAVFQRPLPQFFRGATQLRIPVFENEVERAVRGFRALLDFARLREGEEE